MYYLVVTNANKQKKYIYTKIFYYISKINISISIAKVILTHVYRMVLRHI